MEIPQTVFECGGCEKDLNVLDPYLNVQIKAQREVIVTDDPADTEGEISEPGLYLGTKSGRGRIVKFHGFDCLFKYARERKDYEVKIEPHLEDEIFVPEDNRSPEELAEQEGVE